MKAINNLAANLAACRTLFSGFTATRHMQWDQEQVKAKLAELELEHSDLDDVINRLIDEADFDQIKVGRLKKRKLALKDQIVTLRGRLIPDIIA